MRFLLAAAVIALGFVATPALAAKIEARVDLSQQKMRVYKNGRLQYTWAISSGRRGYGTPTGTWRPTRMHKEYYSKKYHGAPMPYSIFYYRGFAIHGTNHVKRLGRPASHGCIRLHPSNARTLFNLVRSNGPRNTVVRVVH